VTCPNSSKIDTEIRFGDADAGITDVKRDGVCIRIRGAPDAHFPLFGELDRVRQEIAQDLRYLALVGVERRDVLCILEDQRNRITDEQRPQHAAKRAEQLLHFELDRRHHRLASFHLGEVEQVVDQLRQALCRFADKPHLFFLLQRQITVGAGEQEPR
jgi:hypothetical protein